MSDYADKLDRLAENVAGTQWYWRNNADEIVDSTSPNRLARAYQEARREIERLTRDRCEDCGSKVSSYPKGCPQCGAPECCQSCCKRHTAESALAALREQAERDAKVIEEMRQTLKVVAAQFRTYEAHHAQKGSVDGDVKARRNAAWAERCESALAARAKEPGHGS